MMNPFNELCFKNGSICFTVRKKPVSLQGKKDKKDNLKNHIQNITTHSEYIVTGTCWIAIDYYCKHINRLKNPGVYDMDNIIKPILDGLVGQKGLIIDDVIVDRVTVNWIDTHLDDYFDVELCYPDLNYLKKSELIFIKSKSGWCFPIHAGLAKILKEDNLNLIKLYFETWDSIQTEDDYHNHVYGLPIQQFIYYEKIRDSGYKFEDLIL
jgi:hypothetical protein